MRLIGFVALGGAAGSVARFLLGALLQSRDAGAFPWGTFTINLTGSLLLGFLLRVAMASTVMSPELRALLTVGFCGGYTTFSTYSYRPRSSRRAGTTARPRPMPSRAWCSHWPGPSSASWPRAVPRPVATTGEPTGAGRAVGESRRRGGACRCRPGSGSPLLDRGHAPAGRAFSGSSTPLGLHRQPEKASMRVILVPVDGSPLAETALPHRHRPSRGAPRPRVSMRSSSSPRPPTRSPRAAPRSPTPASITTSASSPSVTPPRSASASRRWRKTSQPASPSCTDVPWSALATRVLAGATSS
ncbi:MAG: fluoride efflux transporter CrcB [Gemmatimonadetes bacterium]|nr:fluoride efflux transporter CrcB [Gemmatimonadota bacterium]